MSNKHRSARKAKQDRLRHLAGAPAAERPPLTPLENNTVNDEALIAEFNANAALRSEFGDVDAYCAYRRAEIAGFVKTNRPVNTPPPADLDPERAKFRALWDGPLKPHHHVMPGNFDQCWATLQKASARDAAKSAFPAR